MSYKIKVILILLTLAWGWGYPVCQEDWVWENYDDCDYATNAHLRSYPDGMDTQVFRLETLKRSYQMTNDLKEREHVTLHIRRHPELFRHAHLAAPDNLALL